MGRNRTLDGVRGCLAVLVVANHAAEKLGSPALDPYGRAAVWAFFMMSAYVLTRAWDGSYGAFLARRVLRLWPTYALCLVAAYLLAGEAPDTAQLLWATFAWAPVDPPVWSLKIEAAAMLAMPLIVLVRTGPRLVIALLATALAMICLSPYFVHAALFFAGAYLSRFDIRLAPLEIVPVQWLGRISYPLYLCHWPVLSLLGLPLWASIPIAFAVAAVLTETVERWSIAASRRTALLTLQGNAVRSGIAK